MGAQLLGGILAGFSYFALFGKVFNLAPGAGFGWWEAMLVEVLYTFMLCFVVLTVAATKATEGNQYYGLAIGFEIVAGGYAGGGVSGGAFNAAMAFGIDVPSAGLGFGWSFAYLAYELIGAALAAGPYRVVHPEEYSPGTTAPGVLLREKRSSSENTESKAARTCWACPLQPGLAVQHRKAVGDAEQPGRVQPGVAVQP